MRVPRSLIVPAVIAVAVACAQPGVAQSTTRRVNVIMTCPQSLENETVALSVTVAPWLRTAVPGDTISWNLVVAGGGNGDSGITVSSSDWPLQNPSYSGQGGVDVTVPDDATLGDSSYEITLSCNDTQVVIDPGMRVHN